MTLLIEAPASRLPERRYIIQTLLGEFLGLDWQLVEAERTSVRITLGGARGAIELPDILFSTSTEQWLSAASLPKLPISRWDTSSLGLPITLVAQWLPVIYGDTVPTARRSSDCIYIPVDVFGSSFFMLSRYEEVAAPSKDQHHRFPAAASLAHQEGFLDRPIVNEYLEVLWSAIQAMWPGLQRRPRHFRSLISCDVDYPFSPTTSPVHMLRAAAGDLLVRRSPGLLARRLLGYAAAPFGSHAFDPFNTFDWMMDVNEACSNRLAFYFICGQSDAAMDGNYRITDPPMLRLLTRIHQRGHEIGLHPSYNTFADPDQMGREACTLRDTLNTHGIPLTALGSRQHFLRWRTPETAVNLASQGVGYDTTLAYADTPGFRCGTCYEYQFFDVVRGSVLELRERPLIVMEVSVMDGQYLNLGTSNAALNLMDDLRQKVRKFNGDFTLLWHNSSLLTAQDCSLYKEMIA